jgi:pilus assembly protein CpaB
MSKKVAWPTQTALEGTFASAAELTTGGRRLAVASLQRNEPILVSKITGPNGRATLSTQIDEGMRAVSVRVDEVRGVAGFVSPGDRVDVILTRAAAARLTRPPMPTSYSRTH